MKILQIYKTSFFFFCILFFSSFSFSYEVKKGVLSTPDDRFENLKDYAFKPNYMIITLGGAGNFVQEEVGPELAEIIINFIEGEEVTDLVTSKD